MMGLSMRWFLQLLGLAALALGLTTGCSCPVSSPDTATGAVTLADDEFSVMTYNVYRYGFADRDFDGQEDDFKPADEINAVSAVIGSVHPDILSVQEIGNAYSFDFFRNTLASNGMTYAYSAYLPGPSTYANLGVLSRFPIESVLYITNETYTIQGTTLPVSRGYIEAVIAVSDQYRIRLFNTHLKSKRFNELGQTEMRRNEARILNRIVRQRMDEFPDDNIIVMGDCNDTIGSSAIHELMGEDPDQPVLHPLPLADPLGDVWTHFWAREDTYSRIDYIMVNDAMKPEFVPEKSMVIRHDMGRKASDHRPLVSVFKAYNLPSASP